MKYRYRVYVQDVRDISNCPKTDGTWQHVCDTESDKGPGEYNWNSIVLSLTGESILKQSSKGIWYRVEQEEL